MVIVSSVIESNKPKLYQRLNIRRLRIYHSYDRFSFALNLEVNQEQIRKYLNIVKYDIVVFLR